MVDGPIVFAGLMPHAPILVPGVGRERLAEVAATVQSMATVSSHAMAAQADTLVLISPHSPRQPGAFGLWQTRKLRGSLARFGSPESRVELPLDRAFAERLETAAARRGLRTWSITGEPLDHGAMVPLCYLVSAGWKGPTLILGLNYTGDGGCDELGEAIAATARELNRRTAIIASGDMSHRLTTSAPCGYHPDAHRFDETFIALLQTGAFREIIRIDASLQELAAQDVTDSTTVALAATGYRTDGHAMLSYEGPFGVGYGVAILFEPEHSDRRGSTVEKAGRTLTRFTELPAVARCAVEAQFRDGSKMPRPRAAGDLTERHGVFVTLRTDDGALRGCRGTMQPVESDLVQETWRNAVATAFHDHRFPPVRAADLPHLRCSVSVLEELEPVASPEALDPAIYGVLVSAADGRKGGLLPAIAGIDSVEQQLAVARRKAGIAPDEWIGIQRFRARCFREPNFVEEGG
jgi:AmmeMemoRadiSam system protein A